MARVTVMYVGLINIGLVGVIVAPAISSMITYPVQIYLVYRYRGWDPLHDAIFLSLTVALCALGVWLNQDALLGLWQGSAL